MFFLVLRTSGDFFLGPYSSTFWERFYIIYIFDTRLPEGQSKQKLFLRQTSGLISLVLFFLFFFICLAVLKGLLGIMFFYFLIGFLSKSKKHFCFEHMVFAEKI